MNNAVILILFISTLTGIICGVESYITEGLDPQARMIVTLKENEAPEWVKCYGEEKDFLFISNYCVIDTMSVTDIFINENACSISSGALAPTVSGYTFAIHREYSKMYGSLFIIDEDNDGSFFVGSVLHHRHTGTDAGVMTTLLMPEDFILDGKTYNDCIMIDSVNSCYSGEAAEVIRNKITKYVFSKEYGLIYYSFEDGEEFYRWDL